MTAVYVGLDLGGTNAKLGLVSEDGRLIERHRFPVRAERGPEPIIADLVSGVKELISRAGVAAPPLGLAVGAAGVIQPREGVLVRAPNLPGWKNVPLGRLLSEALGLEVRLANDADLFTLGEWLAGAGRGLDYLVGVTLGTGVGGGLVLGGSLYSGAFGSAAEVGHMVIEPEGRPCNCGSRGCLETLSSATGIVRTAKELIESGRECGFEGRPEDLTSAALYDLALAGDQVARESFDRAGRALGVALTTLFNLLGLEGAVFGGGASPSFHLLHPQMTAEFFSRGYVVDPNQIRLVKAELGDDAPLAGAPALFRDQRFC